MSFIFLSVFSSTFVIGSSDADRYNLVDIYITIKTVFLIAYKQVFQDGVLCQYDKNFIHNWFCR